MRTYSELIKLPTFEERFDYLKIEGQSIGEDTFGWRRYLNQRLYTSREWLSIRNKVIARDLGCDLGIEGMDIMGSIYVHHMNPAMISDFQNDPRKLLIPEFLICTSYDTHSAIHYGCDKNLRLVHQDRKPNDTCPWRK